MIEYTQECNNASNNADKIYVFNFFFTISYTKQYHKISDNRSGLKELWKVLIFIRVS